MVGHGGAGDRGRGALIAEGVLAQPHNFDVITIEAHSKKLPLLGPAEVAARLGVTAARMRQLRQEYGPRFPEPVTVLGIGDVYDAAEVDRFKRNVWRRKVGRPPRVEVVEHPHE